MISLKPTRAEQESESPVETKKTGPAAADSFDSERSHQHDRASIGAGRSSWARFTAYGILPGLALSLAMGVGYLRWQDSVSHDRVAGESSVAAAVEGTIALLSYRHDTVDSDIESARSRLTGAFLEAYTSLTDDVVIPGAKRRGITAVATVPAAASVSADRAHAVALLFVDQAITVGNDAPVSTASSVRVSLEKIDGRWLISGFDPV